MLTYLSAETLSG
jgi:hypothetical protein